LWKALPDKIKGDNSSIVVRDGSGSMTCQISNNTKTTCLDVSTALSIYFAERQSRPMKDKFITFSSKPQLIDMTHCETLKDKLNLCYRYDDYTNTNIEKTFDLLLNTLVENNAKREDVPKNIVIISDMEFDMAVRGWNVPLFEKIKNEWKEAGYELPKMIFWNVNAHRSLFPMVDNERGLITLSGFSTNNLDMILSCDIKRPEQMLDEILSKPRYDAVDKAYDKGVENERKNKNYVVNVNIDYPSAEEKEKVKKKELGQNR